MNERITKQLLFDYFAGKATTFEKQQIDEWSRDTAHEEQFYDWLDEWEQAHRQYSVDQPTALDRYHNFLFADVPMIVWASPNQPKPSETPLTALGLVGGRPNRARPGGWFGPWPRRWWW